MDRSAELLDPVWKALADPTRGRLLELLRDGPRTVSQPCEPFAAEVTRFAVMKHLGVLKEAGLVLDRKQGRQVWSHLNAVPLRLIYERGVNRYAGVWARSLVSLRRHAAPGKSEREHR